jgi:hypothetical protein
MRPFVGVFDVRMVNIFAVRKKLQIFKPVIASIQILMVNLKTPRNWPVKRLPHGAVYADMLVFAAYAWRKVRVSMAIKPRFYRPRSSVAAPSFAVFNRKHGGYAGVQERRNVRQLTPVIQHLFGFDNLFRRKFFSSCGPAHIAKIADFVQCLVPNYRCPNFHEMSPLTSYNLIPNLIKGQA